MHDDGSPPRRPVESNWPAHDDDDDDIFVESTGPLRRYASEPCAASTSPPPDSEPDESDGGYTDAADSQPSASLQHHPHPTPSNRPFSFSLWDHLHREIMATDDVDGANSADLRAERVTNFLSVPIATEKIFTFGFFICLDSFLYTFTILPLRVCAAAVRLATGQASNVLHRLPLLRGAGSRGVRRLSVSHKVDLMKGLLVILSCTVLHGITDTSQMYHSVRGQDTIKLYVIYNALEIADRLCCSFGQDILDSLFSRSTLARRTDGSQPRLRPIVLFMLALTLTVSHTLVLSYQLVALNVAINSYDNALLTLLLSNQFVEIKGSVLKKFEKENLFQMTCADIVERFQLSLLLAIISFRNLIELSGSSFSQLPTSFALLPSLSKLQTVLTPAATVLASEIGTDWLKHAFINKFNHIRPAVYGRFMDVLCKDLITDQSSQVQSQPFVDQSPVVARRLGFAVFPFGCLLVRVAFQTIEMLSDVSHIDECSPTTARSSVARGSLATFLTYQDISATAARWSFTGAFIAIGWACLVAIKLLLGIKLRAYAHTRFATMSERVQEDILNAKGRSPIGTDRAEIALNAAVSALINAEDFDAESKPKDAIRMEDLDRFTMTRSRIW